MRKEDRKDEWHQVGGLRVCNRTAKPFNEAEFIAALMATQDLSHLSAEPRGPRKGRSGGQ